MQRDYNMGHELGAAINMKSVLHTRGTDVTVIQNGGAHAATHGPPAFFMAENDVDGSLNHQALSQVSLGANAASGTAYPIAVLQPTLACSASVQSSQTLVFNNNRSMSDLVNNLTDNGTLEHGRAGGCPVLMRPSATENYRAGLYREAIEGFLSEQRLYISIVTFVVMFGMTVAGLWLEIAGSHQTLV